MQSRGEIDLNVRHLILPMNKKHARLWWLLCFALLTACNSNSNPTMPPMGIDILPGTGQLLMFPRRTSLDKQRVTSAARYEGKVILKDGCLRTEGDFGNIIIVWPWDYTYKTLTNNNGIFVIQIIDEKEQVIAQEGDKIIIDGGNTSFPLNEKEIPKEWPSTCRDKKIYWSGGGKVLRSS